MSKASGNVWVRVGRLKDECGTAEVEEGALIVEVVKKLGMGIQIED